MNDWVKGIPEHIEMGRAVTETIWDVGEMIEYETSRAMYCVLTNEGLAVGAFEMFKDQLVFVDYGSDYMFQADDIKWTLCLNSPETGTMFPNTTPDYWL